MSHVYKIVRVYLKDSSKNKIIATGLTLEEAQVHCNDPETSSSTCTNLKKIRHTEKHGPWFDGYQEEK